MHATAAHLAFRWLLGKVLCDEHPCLAIRERRPLRMPAPTAGRRSGAGGAAAAGRWRRRLGCRAGACSLLHVCILCGSLLVLVFAAVLVTRERLASCTEAPKGRESAHDQIRCTNVPLSAASIPR